MGGCGAGGCRSGSGSGTLCGARSQPARAAGCAMAMGAGGRRCGTRRHPQQQPGPCSPLPPGPGRCPPRLSLAWPRVCSDLACHCAPKQPCPCVCSSGDSMSRITVWTQALTHGSCRVLSASPVTVPGGQHPPFPPPPREAAAARCPRTSFPRRGMCGGRRGHRSARAQGWLAERVGSSPFPVPRPRCP